MRRHHPYKTHASVDVLFTTNLSHNGPGAPSQTARKKRTSENSFSKGHPGHLELTTKDQRTTAHLT